MTQSSGQERTVQLDNGHVAVLIFQTRTEEHTGVQYERPVATCRGCSKVAEVYSPDLFNYIAREMHGLVG